MSSSKLNGLKSSTRMNKNKILWTKPIMIEMQFQFQIILQKVSPFKSNKLKIKFFWIMCNEAWKKKSTNQMIIWTSWTRDHIA